MEDIRLLLSVVLLAVLSLVFYAFGPALSRLTHLPVITIYLAAGLLSQLFMPGSLHKPLHDLLQPVHDAALGCITLAAGGELVLEQLRANARAISCITLWLSLASLGLVFPVTLFVLVRFEPLGPGPLSLKVVMAMCAAVVSIARSPSSAIAVVAEQRADGPFTQTVLGVTMVTDVVVVVLFTAAIELADLVLSPPNPHDANLALIVGFSNRALLRIGLSMACGFWVAMVAYLLLKLPRGYGLQEAALLLLGGLTFSMEGLLRLLLRSSVEADLSASVRLEPMLSCIVAGFLLCNVLGQRAPFSALLHTVMTPALCFFFVTTGSSMQIAVIRHSLPMTLCLCGARTAALWCGSFFGSICGGASRESRTLGWLAYMTQAGVSLGLTDEIVAKFPGWGHKLQAPLVSAIVFNQLFGPPALKYALRAARENGQQADPHDDETKALAESAGPLGFQTEPASPAYEDVRDTSDDLSPSELKPLSR